MPGVKRFVKFAVRLFVVFFLFFVGAVLYLDIRGFPAGLRGVVERQFLRAGYAVKFGTIHLDVLRGVIATDAVVADASTPKQILARIDEVQLHWNWRRLVRREMPIEALHIANATVSVPTPADDIGPEMFTAKEAYATFRFLDDRTTEIDQLTGVYCGIRVRVSGRVKPRVGVLSEEEQRRAAARSQFSFITKSLRELNSLKVSQAPQLDVVFSLDLAQPLDSQVRARLVGDDLGYRKLQVQKASVNVFMHDGAIDLSECRLQVGGGELSLLGRFDIARGEFDLRLNSSVDPTQVASAISDDLKRALQDLRVEENPRIEARYVLSPETGSLPLLRGTVQTGGLTVRGVPFRSISLTFENQGPDVKVTDARIVTAEGLLTGHGQYQIESSDFTYEIDSTLDPRKLLPIMTPVMKKIVDPGWFETPPHIVASVSGDFVDPDAFAYDATLTTGRCSYRGVSLAGVDAKIQLRHSRLNVPSLLIERTDGYTRGSLLTDFNNHQITFDVTTSSNPNEMAPLLGPKPAQILRPYRFGPRTQASGRGLVDLDAPGNSAWTAHVVNNDFSYWKLTADRATATIVVTNNILTIEDFDSDFYGGKLTGRAVFALTNAPNYAFDFNTDRVEVRKLMTDIRGGKDPKSSGLLNGHCALQGQGSDLNSIRGEGNAVVTDGVLGELGLFGIFSQILNSLSPGLGQTRLTSATSTFKLADSAAKIDDLQMQAGSFTLTSQGRIDFDCRLDFRVQGQLLRAVPGINILTWFLKNLFEYKVGGTCSAPTYRPTNLPKEFMPHGVIGDSKPPEK
jgi:hypothetical protein